MQPFEFVIRKRPLSLQAKGKHLQQWKAFVKGEAAKAWNGARIDTENVHVTMVYFCAQSPPDIDNILKPILDALVGLVFADDALVADLQAHRRSLTGTFDLTRMPHQIARELTEGQEFVFVRVTTSLTLEAYV